MCTIIEGIDAEIFMENLNNSKPPSDEEIEAIKAWALPFPKPKDKKYRYWIYKIWSNLWLLMGVAGGMGGFIISGNLGTIVTGVVLGLMMGYIFFKEK